MSHARTSLEADPMAQSASLMDSGYPDALHEECAVTGVVGGDAAGRNAEMLFALNHRGQESSGIATQNPDGTLNEHRGVGLVQDVYDEQIIERLGGEMGVGQNRYSTNGSKTSLTHLQPVIDLQTGVAFSHNGNLPVTQKLGAYLEERNILTRRLNDSGMAGMAIAQAVREGRDLPDAVEFIYPLLRGSFSCTAMHGDTLVAFRDQKGIRPLAVGELDDGIAVASETAGLDIVNAKYLQEVPPGAMMVITRDGIQETRQLAEPDSKLDMFELVYFARPDSILYDQYMSEFRRQCGRELAVLHPPQVDDSDNVIVVPVPQTSVHAAEGYAEALRLNRRDAIYKNPFVSRAFISGGNADRQQKLRRKHSILPGVEGKDVVLIDDSIVRLDTMPRLVRLMREHRAKSVTVLVASSPVRYPDFYGIDTPRQSELAAANLTVEAMREKMHANYLGYLTLSRMVAASGRPASDFNLSCFTGVYPIGIGDRKKEVSNPVSMEYIDVDLAA